MRVAFTLAPSSDSKHLRKARLPTTTTPARQRQLALQVSPPSAPICTSCARVMRVCTAKDDADNLVNHPKARAMTKRIRAPNCTHVEMDRIYGRDHECWVCGRPPSLGFLYECRQDRHSDSLRDVLSRDKVKIEPVRSDLRVQLEHVGLSEAVILAAERGHYTDSQLAKLKTLKLELRQVIADVEQKTAINYAVSKLAVIASTPSNNDGAFNSTLATEAPPGCTFRACHSCRPYFRDRVYISFQDVLSANFAPVTREDTQLLPTKSSRIMRNIGQSVCPPLSPMTYATTPSTLPTTASPATSTEVPNTASTTSTGSSSLTFKTSQTDIEVISAQRFPRRKFYKIGHRSSRDIGRDLSRLPPILTRQGLRAAVQSIFRSGRDSSSSGSNITLPLPRTGTVRDVDQSESVGEFDLAALRRVRRQKEKAEVKKRTLSSGFEDMKRGKSAMSLEAPHSTAVEVNGASESNLSGYSASSEGSEVAVKGGVALTEEAVEMNTPDILAIDVSVPKMRAMIQSAAVDESAADIGLQSIMAQV